MFPPTFVTGIVLKTVQELVSSVNTACLMW